MRTSNRINVALIEKADEALAELCRTSGLSVTDVVNRALQAYGYLDAERRAGRTLLVRDEETREVERIRFV